MSVFRKVSQSGLTIGIAAYVLWGFMPIYWKLGNDIPAMVVASHRVVWSLLLITGFLLISRGRKYLQALFELFVESPRLYLMSASSIGLNWCVYIWAVSNGYMLASSLGYLLSPLIYIFLGVRFLGERLENTQRWATVFGCVSVVPLIFTGDLTSVLVAMILSTCITVYGLCKKMSKLPQVEGLWLDLVVMSVVAVPFLLLEIGSGATGLTGSFGELMWVLATGPMTVVPLLLFASALRSLPLSSIGFLQYINPSIQFILASVMYGEVVDIPRALSFSIAWIGVLLLVFESLRKIALEKRRARVRVFR